MTRSNLLAAALIGLLLAGSIALQVSTREDVSDLGSRVQRVEKVIACEQRSDCRAFIRQVVRSLLADAEQMIEDPKGGGSPSTPSASSQPPPPPSGGGGPDNPGGNPPPEPPPAPSPLEPICQLTPQLCDLLP